MAVAVGGETLHHVAGINPFISSAATKEERHISAERLGKRLLEMRWLIIDEISMISANLLAQVDMKLRDAVRERGTYKLGADGKVRSFGGLSVIFAGDFCQLDPPDGIPITAVPKDKLSLRKDITPPGTAAHGHQLFWGTTFMSVRSMTELKQPYRCKDEWYNEFLEECRAMDLSEDNYNFLHGRETTVPGSWLHGKAQCGTQKCQTLPRSLRDLWALERQQNIPRDQRTAECAKCKTERLSRCRVAKQEDHPDFKKNKFLRAPIIVANNDVKYDTNKRRATQFAHTHKETIFWRASKDNVTLEALRDNPSLPLKKLDWLQRHDRDCSDLYGMFPLVKGMPVSLTDHIDRNPEKNLLRGRTGHIYSWILHDDDLVETYPSSVILAKQLKVVFIKFPNASHPPCETDVGAGQIPQGPTLEDYPAAAAPSSGIRHDGTRVPRSNPRRCHCGPDHQQGVLARNELRCALSCAQWASVHVVIGTEIVIGHHTVTGLAAVRSTRQRGRLTMVPACNDSHVISIADVGEMRKKTRTHENILQHEV